MLYQLSHLELVEMPTVFCQYESAVEHWELGNFCDMASTASKMASKDAKTQFIGPKWPSL